MFINANSTWVNACDAEQLVDRTTGIRFEYDLPTFAVVYHRYQVLLLLLVEQKPDGNLIQHECQGSKKHR